MANEGEVSRKRPSASIASAAESSKRRWTKRSSPEIHDAEALNRNLLRNLKAPASVSARAQIVQGHSNSVSGLVEKLQVEISDLRRQQAIDRATFEAALNAHDEELEELQNALNGNRRGDRSRASHAQ